MIQGNDALLVNGIQKQMRGYHRDEGGKANFSAFK
jgi:hypothetical protein